jgi:hypothetical protein
MLTGKHTRNAQGVACQIAPDSSSFAWFVVGRRKYEAASGKLEMILKRIEFMTFGLQDLHCKCGLDCGTIEGHERQKGPDHGVR